MIESSTRVNRNNISLNVEVSINNKKGRWGIGHKEKQTNY